MIRHHAILMGTALGAMLIATPGLAQTAEQAPADIVVTAQRRAEKVTKVPISITVADSAALERQQVNTVNDLNRIAPSLEIQSAPGQNTGGGGAIRGIGTQTFSGGAVASVGIVVDQVSQGNANISDLFDVARIEVLKGPQGTLFGLTTSAGVINVTTNRPEFGVVSARVRTELSGAGTAGSLFGRQIVQGVVNVPLADRAALRVSAFGNLRQGPGRNATTGQYNDNDTYGARAKLRWEPTDLITVNVIGDYSRNRITNGGDFFTFIKAGGPGAFFGGAGYDAVGIKARLASCGVSVGVGNRDYCSSESYAGTAENYGGSVQVDLNAEPFTLTSITALRHSVEKGYGASTNVFRGDPLELQVHNSPVNRPLDLVTQELRIASPSGQKVEYTVGAFASSQISRRDDETVSVTLSPIPGLVIPIANNLSNGYRVSSSSLAVFGQATVKLQPNLRLIAGGRFTNDRLALDLLTGTRSHTLLDTSKLSWKFGAQYDLDPKTMAYATVARGYKGGQVATPSGAAPYVIQPEVPTSYEVGLKTTLLRGWVLDAGLFYQTIKNFQAQQCTVDSNAVISCVQRNIDGVKSRGAEISLFGKVTRNLSLNTGFIWAKATYPTGFIGTDGTNIGGTQLAYAPEYKFTLSGEYTKALTSRANGFIAVDTVWKSRVRYEANSLKSTTYLPHWTVGGRIGVRSADERFSVAVFARNLFNVHEPSLMQSDFPYNGGSNIGAIYGTQSFRQVGLSLDGKF